MNAPSETHSLVRTSRRASLRVRLRRAWRIVNSAAFISFIGSLFIAWLTSYYTAHQSDVTDIASRRAELARLLVELDVRVARLQIAVVQLRAAATASSDALTRDGARAIAIVKGDQTTVTSNPAFQNEHLVSVLSRAEIDAGLNLTDKSYLLGFTDLTDCAALERTPYVVSRVLPLVHFLHGGVTSGAIPLSASKMTSNTYTAQVYTAVVTESTAAADRLASTSAAPEGLAKPDRCA